MPRLTLQVPSDYSLVRDCCSYGYFLLAPNRWDVVSQSLSRVLTLPERSVFAVVNQPGGAGSALRVVVWPDEVALSAAERAAIREALTRMLRLDEGVEALRAFHRLDPRWKKSGRGRLFRSPSMFEDVIKTVTNCNVTWHGTVQMNRHICEALGPRVKFTVRGIERTEYGFPSAKKVASTRVQTLRARCRVGYRDARIVELGKLFAKPPGKGGFDQAMAADPVTPDDVVREALIDLPGIGPYAAANILQLLGRFGHLPLDTESVRHGTTVLKFRGSSKAIMERVQRHFAPFGEHAFRSYWFELWEFYESKLGPAHLWERDSTGKMFTAALLNKVSL